MRDSKACVAGEGQNAVVSPEPVGERQARAQVSTLLLPNAARTSFWTRKVSSLVHREDVIAPIEPRPYFFWMRLNSAAAYSIASRHVTSRHGSPIDLRIIGCVIRSGVPA